MKVDALAYPTLGTGADLLQMLLHAQRRRGLKSWEIALQQLGQRHQVEGRQRRKRYFLRRCDNGGRLRRCEPLLGLANHQGQIGDGR